MDYRCRQSCLNRNTQRSKLERKKCRSGSRVFENMERDMVFGNDKVRGEIVRAGSLGTLEGKLTRREEFKELRAPFLEGSSGSVILSQGQFCLPGTLGDIWGHFRLSQRGAESDTALSGYRAQMLLDTL